MPQQRNTDDLIRHGVSALPLAGLLALAGLYSTFKLGPGGILASGDNRAIVSTGYFVSQLVGNGLALTLLIFGVVALFAYLASSGQRALALGAMVSSICGISLTLTGLGVYAYTVPALSRSYLGGKPESIRILDYIYRGSPWDDTHSDLLALFGGLHPLWRCHLALWGAAPVGGRPPGGSCTAGLRTILDCRFDSRVAAGGRGGWIALSVLRPSPAQRVRAEVESRVS